MADRITVYVPPDLHRQLKTAASARGMTLSDFMVRAAERALERPDREVAARQMDRVRSLFRSPLTGDDVRSMREEGRRF